MAGSPDLSYPYSAVELLDDESLAPRAGWTLLARLHMPEYTAVFFIRDDGSHGDNKPFPTCLGVLDILVRQADGLHALGAVGTTFVDPFNIDGQLIEQALVIDTDPVVWFRFGTGFEAVGGLCSSLVDTIEVKHKGSILTHSVTADRRAFVVGVATPPPATMRFLDSDGSVLSRAGHIVELGLDATATGIVGPDASVACGLSEWKSSHLLNELIEDETVEPGVRAEITTLLRRGTPASQVLRRFTEGLPKQAVARSFGAER